MGNICECGDPQSQHRASKYGCRALECVCTKYVLDIPATKRARFAADHGAVEPDADAVLARVALPLIEIQPEPVADDGVPEEPRVLNAAERGPQPIPPGWSPDGASMLTRLVKAERERDEKAAALSNALKCFDDLQTAAGRKYEDLGAERDEALARVRELEQDIDRDTGEHKLAAELASAKQELERLRAVPVPDVDLEGRLAEARAELDVLRESLKGSASTANVALRDLAEARTEVDNLRLSRDAAESQRAEARQVIEAMEEDRPTTVAPTGNVIDTYTRWFCQPITGCGGQYEIEQDDNYCACGKQLLAITVTAAITHH
jgi:hypothetical protein